jgi:AcrR family transcriptional regulator
MTTTRDAILDAALEVLRTRGLARATTKEIARASGFSEGTLYKLFTDKTDLVLCVFAERLPQVTVMTSDVAALVGKDSVQENLTAMLIEIEQLFDASLPIAMAVFSDPGLLAREAEAINARGGPGPGFIIARVGEYLRGEQAAGRVSSTAPLDAAATALVGACLHHAFSSFYTRGQAEDRSEAFAALADGVATTILHGICDPP